MGTQRDLSHLRDELREISAELAKSNGIVEEQRDRRAALVEEAREAGLTWREISALTGVTEHGLIKAQAAAKKGRVEKAAS